MSAAKHTPGPWYCDGRRELLNTAAFKNQPIYEATIVANDARKTEVARVMAMDFPGNAGVTMDQAEANANLIAHTPLLLEAATLAEEALAMAVREAETDADHRTYLDAWRAISQAVAKSTTVPLRATGGGA